MSVEAIEEVQTTKGVTAAEYGHQLSGNVNLTSRSGTNLLHGSLFEGFRAEHYPMPHVQRSGSRLPADHASPRRQLHPDRPRTVQRYWRQPPARQRALVLEQGAWLEADQARPEDERRRGHFEEKYENGLL